MTSILLYFFMAVGLSMDAFSLAIVYGTNQISKNKAILLSLFVGILHFVMPNVGSLLGKQFLTKLIVYGNIITAIVFLILSIQMILSFNEKEEIKSMDNYLEMLFFAIAVSIDSFTVGLALSLDNQNLILGGVIFSIVSAIFTFSGLLLGRLLNDKIGSISKIIGIIILVIFSVKYFFNI